MMYRSVPSFSQGQSVISWLSNVSLSLMSTFIFTASLTLGDALLQFSIHTWAVHILSGSSQTAVHTYMAV